MIRTIYLSPFGYIISILSNVLSFFKRPFMVYGYYCRNRNRFFKYTRISSSAVILSRDYLNISDHCWIGHHCLIDASGGLEIGEGVQISSLNSVITHSSHISIRLLGRDFLKVKDIDRIGYLKSPVEIGDYSFIGSGSIVLPGTKIGRGCVIGAGSVVKGDIPDFSIVIGNPAKIVGTTEFVDKQYINFDNIEETYYDRQHLNDLRVQSKLVDT